DVIVPVPLGRRRFKERRYNEASEIAAGVEHALGRPCHPRALARVRETAPQTTLARSARRENVRGAYRARLPPGVRHVLLVDDVVTTGATVEEAARALRRAGAREVSVLSVARAMRTWNSAAIGGASPVTAARTPATRS